LRSPFQPSKKAQYSDRIAAIEPTNVDTERARIMIGEPPNGERFWSKEMLVNALTQLEEKKLSNAFIAKVLEKTNSRYSHPSAIYKLYSTWKKEKVVPTQRGRPCLVDLNVAEGITKKVVHGCKTDSSAFRLQDMKRVYSEKKRQKAEADGLDRDTVDCLPQPTFTVYQAHKQVAKLPSEYLRNLSWLRKLKSVVKGVQAIPIDEELMSKAVALGRLLEPRPNQHIAERVNKSRHNHWAMRFSPDNMPPMAAAMCLVGHIIDDIECYSIAECLLTLTMDETFQVVSSNLSSLEGCYLYFDRQ